MMPSRMRYRGSGSVTGSARRECSDMRKPRMPNAHRITTGNALAAVPPPDVPRAVRQKSEPEAKRSGRTSEPFGVGAGGRPGKRRENIIPPHPFPPAIALLPFGPGGQAKCQETSDEIPRLRRHHRAQSTFSPAIGPPPFAASKISPAGSFVSGRALARP